MSQRSTLSRQRGRLDDIEQTLIGLKCAKRVQKKTVPSNAGILFFARDPQAHYQSEVVCVLYRDYSRRGESIRVFYYADRIEIHSPGLLLPGITVEQMRRGEVTSKLRNLILANLLRDIPGYMERVGSEIRLMLNETSEFVLTFLKALVGAAAAPSPKETLWGSEEGQQDALVEPPPLLEQEQRMQQAMQYVREHGTITNTLYRDLTGISEATARRDLEALVGRQYRLP